MDIFSNVRTRLLNEKDHSIGAYIFLITMVLASIITLATKGVYFKVIGTFLSIITAMMIYGYVDWK